jgi:hypothetical protein
MVLYQVLLETFLQADQEILLQLAHHKVKTVVLDTVIILTEVVEVVAEEVLELQELLLQIVQQQVVLVVMVHK